MAEEKASCAERLIKAMREKAEQLPAANEEEAAMWALHLVYGELLPSSSCLQHF